MPCTSWQYEILKVCNYFNHKGPPLSKTTRLVYTAHVTQLCSYTQQWAVLDRWDIHKVTVK